MPLEILTLLLGSALTILGGFMANRHNYELTRRADRDRVTRARLDDLATLICNIEDWIELMEENTFADPPQRTPGEPMDKIYAHATIYFPELWSDIHPVCLNGRLICQSVRKEASRRLREMTISDSYVQERTALWEPFLRSKDAAPDAIARFAKNKNC